MRAVLLLVPALACVVLGCKPVDCSPLSDDWFMAQVGNVTHMPNASNHLCPEVTLGTEAVTAEPGPDARSSAEATVSNVCVACLRACVQVASTAAVKNCLDGACASSCPGAS